VRTRSRLPVLIAVLALAAVGVTTGAILLASGPPEVQPAAEMLPALNAERAEQPALRADFDESATGGLPARFTSARTGPGPDGAWRVEADDAAATPPNVLVQRSDDPTSARFPLAVAQDVRLADLDVSVAIKPLSGKVDQAGGIVFRYRDPNHYYLVRSNALENNVRLYHVTNGKRSQIAGADTTIPGGQWHTLRVVCLGDRTDVYLGDTRIIGHRDTTITDAGAIGLWTKADSITVFDHLEVWPLRR
jgi:hypothetical protein